MLMPEERVLCILDSSSIFEGGEAITQFSCLSILVIKNGVLTP